MDIAAGERDLPTQAGRCITKPALCDAPSRMAGQIDAGPGLNERELRFGAKDPR